MKRWVYRGILTILVSVIALSMPVARAAQDEHEGTGTVVLSGEIEVARSDDDGNVTAVGIYDSEWGSVLIANSGKGTELLKHVGDLVRIAGKLTEGEDDSDYSYVIHVSDFTLEQAGNSEEDYDDDWEPEQDE